MINYKTILLLFGIAFRGHLYAQTLTDYNTFEGVNTTKNVIDICSKSWDTVYMFTAKNYFYVDTNCITKQPRFCLENVKHNSSPILLSDSKRKVLLSILRNKKSYVSTQKIAPNSIVMTGCNNNFEYNTFFILKSQNGRIMIFYCSEKENNYSLLYQENRIAYTLWDSCIDFDAHNDIFENVVPAK